MPIADARSPGPAADGLFAVTDRLHSMGVTIIETLMTDLAHWDDATATMRLRADAPIAHQIRALLDLWMMLVFGPEYAEDAVPCLRRLRLVAEPG